MTKTPQPKVDPIDTRSLVTFRSLARDFRALGIEEGDKLLVHASISSFGFIVGGGRTLIESLLKAVGDTGTVMMPTFSGENSDPSEWLRPPVPKDWIEIIRDETPAYDAFLTPTRGMGSLPELFRHYPGARRSPHPQSSFAAIGKDAHLLVDEHPLADRFGSNSPLGKLYALDGKSILLGASPRKCSLYYLSEERVKLAPKVCKSAPVYQNGQKEWVKYFDYPYTAYWFNQVTDFLYGKGLISKMMIGDAECICLPARCVVEAVTEWRLNNDI